jgi:hypothetical protein
MLEHFLVPQLGVNSVIPQQEGSPALPSQGCDAVPEPYIPGKMYRSLRLHSVATHITRSDTHWLFILGIRKIMCINHPCKSTFESFVIGLWRYSSGRWRFLEQTVGRITISPRCLPHKQGQSYWMNTCKTPSSVNRCSVTNCVVIFLFVSSNINFRICIPYSVKPCRNN